MSVTSGFFNSQNGDRKYNSEQMSALFDGIINDGVFVNVGSLFTVLAGSGNRVTVSSGKAWFNSAWLLNDSTLSLELEASDILLDRYDAVVIEIDHRDSVRIGSIKIVKGIASSEPQKPTMLSEELVHQHPLAYILRKANSSTVSQGDIINVVGTPECPYVTGILEVQTVENIVARFNGLFNEWFYNLKVILGNDTATQLASQFLDLKNDYRNLILNGEYNEALTDAFGNPIFDSDGAPINGVSKVVRESDLIGYTVTDLLWTNTLPNYWMDKNTIISVLNLEEYDMYKVVFGGPGDVYSYVAETAVGSGLVLRLSQYHKEFIATGDNTNSLVYTNSISDNTSPLPPYKIYGIKFLKGDNV